MKGFIINHELNRNFSEKNDVMEEMFFYGVLEDNKSFVWKQTHPYIIAFLTHQIPEQFRKSTWKRVENVFTDCRKNPLWGYFFKNQSSLNELQAAYPDYAYYEGDIASGEQYLMSKHIRGTVEFISDPEKIENNVAYYTEPQVRPIKELFIPSVKTLSLDIETGVESNEIYSIGLYGENFRKVLLWDKCFSNDMEKHKKLEWGEIEICSKEKELLTKFQENILEYNPHVFIGWNVIGFDFNFILRKFIQHNLTPHWGIGGLPVVFFKADKSKSSFIIKIPGRMIIEGMDLVRNVYEPLPNYKLNTAAEYILNEKKIIEKEGKDKINEIERLYREDKNELARYNLYDAQLVFSIFKVLQGIDFVFVSSVLSGVLPDKVFNPHDVIDRYYLPLLHKKKIATYRKLNSQIQIQTHNFEKEFSGGFYQNVAVVEFKNLFLNVIMGYKIDSLGMIRAHIDRDNSSATPSGVFFHDYDNILYSIIQHLLDLQLEARNQSMAILVSVIENILEQITVSFGSNYSRYFLPGLYDALEANVRFVVESIVNKVEDLGSQIIFYDNDSFAITIDKSFEDFSDSFFKAINRDFLFDLFPRLDRKDHYLCSVKRKLFFKKFFFPHQSLKNKNKSTFEYLALDSKGVFIKQGGKKNPLNLTSKLYEQIVYRLLKKENIENYIKDFKKALLEGDLDKELIYRKKLNKKLSEYTGTGQMPPQAVAAMKAKEEFEGKSFFNKNVEYYQTVNGPEPIQALHSTLDYQYYLEKDFLPVIKSVLIHSDQKDLIDLMQNRDQQLSLF